MKDMKELPPQEVLIALLDYDPDTGALMWKSRSNPQFDNRLANKPAFTFRDGYGYATGKIFNVAYRAHRVIWKMAHGTEPEIIDHIDRDCGNNRLANLRSGSQHSNLTNRGPYKTYAGQPRGKFARVRAVA